MDETNEQAVSRAIRRMRDGLSDPLTIEDLARVAMFSKFHFMRIFRRVTGTSPGRFRAALRIEKAKQLLISTSWNVAEISHEVGYASVGTFSSRFTSSVGVPPTTYRRLGGFVRQVGVPGDAVEVQRRASLLGTVRAVHGKDSGVVFVGLFPDRLPEGRPATCTVLPRPGPYRLNRVPEGKWFVVAHAVAAGAEVDSAADTAFRSLSVGCCGPVTVSRGAAIKSMDVRLRPMCALDPPVLPALLDTRSVLVGATDNRRTGRSAPPWPAWRAQLGSSR
jgi:AraC family transcriptional regulator